MNKHLEAALVLLVCILGTIIWWTQYAQPKVSTVLARSRCVHAQGETLNETDESKAAWERCRY